MNGLVLFAGVIFFLWLGRSLLIPLLLATFLWYLTNAIASYYRKIMPFKSLNQNEKYRFFNTAFDWLANILSLSTMGLVILLFITQIRPMTTELVAALPEIQNKLVMFGHYVSQLFGTTLDTNLIPNMSQIIENVGMSAPTIVTFVGMVLIYLLFMFVEQSTFHKKLSSLFPNKTQFKKMRYILDSIDENMKKYLFMKTFISAITGIMSYLWLRTIGLEFAGVWAFIVFLTSYIPTIGAFVACGLPILYALIISPTLHLPVLTALGLIGLQIVFGNILEPKLTGKTLNLSTLAILINLVFWGMLWGIAGMFFSVPLLVATFIITAQFDSTRWIAVLLSADGKIPDKNDD